MPCLFEPCSPLRHKTTMNSWTELFLQLKIPAKARSFEGHVQTCQLVSTLRKLSPTSWKQALDRHCDSEPGAGLLIGCIWVLRMDCWPSSHQDPTPHTILRPARWGAFFVGAWWLCDALAHSSHLGKRRGEIINQCLIHGIHKALWIDPLPLNVFPHFWIRQTCRCLLLMESIEVCIFASSSEGVGGNLGEGFRSDGAIPIWRLETTRFSQGWWDPGQDAAAILSNQGSIIAITSPSWLRIRAFTFCRLEIVLAHFKASLKLSDVPWWCHSWKGFSSSIVNLKRLGIFFLMNLPGLTIAVCSPHELWTHEINNSFSACRCWNCQIRLA